MSTQTTFDPAPVSVRVTLAGLWTATMLVVAFVDLFSLYRADVRADIEAGQMFAFTIGQGFLLGVTAYVAVPSLMIVLSLVLPARVARAANIVIAALFLLTIVGASVGESNYYYLLGSVVEVLALVAIVGYAWRWPRVHEASLTGAPSFEALSR
jgi:hypothetical protein